MMRHTRGVANGIKTDGETSRIIPNGVNSKEQCMEANTMKRQSVLRNQSGFTLIEIIAVLIILGILAAVAVPRYIDLTANAQQRALDAGIAELNGRETLIWADIKLSSSGFTTDNDLFGTVIDTNPYYVLGDPYSWGGSGAPTTSGGTLIYDGNASVALNRDASDANRPGRWYR